MEPLNKTEVANGFPTLPDWRDSTYPAFDLATASTKLKENETATECADVEKSGVRSFFTIRLASNSPMEDDLSHDSLEVGGNKRWNFWGVYDGHSGWATSTVLRTSLIPYVAQELAGLSMLQRPGDVDKAIVSAFLRLDDEILTEGIHAMRDSQRHAEAIARIAPAKSGSCALLAMHDPSTSLLRVACVGDSRAVLGRRSSDSSSEAVKQWTAIPLSEDQTGFNKHEQERIKTDHPDESPLDFKTGRLFGCTVTRSFGDNRYKWPIAALEEWNTRFFSRGFPAKSLTPPYLTAAPIVTTTEVKPGDFLVLATDGMWNHISSEDAIQCVGLWIDSFGKGNCSSTPCTAGESFYSHSTSAHWNIGPEDFVLEDDNVATHLLKNVLGGKQRDLFCSIMTTMAPDSREATDDITVVVVLFA